MKSVKVFDCPEQIGLSTFFKSSKPALTEPVIVDKFVDDEGETQYVYANGNTCHKGTHDILWIPQKRRGHE